jgi:Uma2 family endonuclease
MSVDPISSAWISTDDYLRSERDREVRHEYVDGQIYAMAGASDDHGRIAGNIFAELRGQLRGRPCEAFIADMKVKIPPSFVDAFYYPDVLVACSPTDRDRYFREEPAVIFEVLSPGTERIDRLEKPAAYLHIPSLQAYAIVAQDRCFVNVRFRTEARWQFREYTKMEEAILFPGIGCELSVASIYERVSWL